MDILKAVEASDCLHLYNLAQCVSKEDKPEDKVVVINYNKNRPYGCCIDRGSKVTIVFTSGFIEPITGWFAYHIAKLGGFNYVAKEIEVDPDNPVTFYNIEDENACPNMRLFLDDINRLSSRPGSWVIPVLAATGARTRPHQFHFCYNTKKGDESYDDKNARISDYEAFDKAYRKMEYLMGTKYNYHCDKNIWYPALNKKNIAYHINAENVFTLRVEAFVWVYDAAFLAITKDVADVLNEAFEPDVHKDLPPEMLERRKGHDFGFADYLD